MKKDSDDPQFVTALARGLDVLRCFTQDRQELGTTEIAKLTGLPQPTVWRLCYTLTQVGCLMPGIKSDKLRIGPGVLLLGHASITHGGIGNFALPLMKPLADRFGASVSLGARDRGAMVIIQRSEAEGIVNVNLHIGSTLSLVNSSLGWAWLAAATAEQREQVLAPLREAAATDWTPIQRDIDQALGDYAAQGFVFNLGKSHADINAVGVPVISPDGRRIMALTCGGLRTRMTRQRLVAEVAPALKNLASQLAPALTSMVTTH